MQLSHVQAQLATNTRDSEIQAAQYRKDIDSKNVIIAELADHVRTAAAPLEALEATQIKMCHLGEQLEAERCSNLLLQQQIERLQADVLAQDGKRNDALLSLELQADRELHADHCLRLGIRSSRP